MKNFILIILSSISFLSAVEYYVSTTGDSLGLGTFNNPFLKVQQAADIMQAGDICYIRQGVYHENVVLDNQDGTAGSPIVFTSYEDERVVFDGTVSIDSSWTPYSNNIWSTYIDFDIWQFFIDYNEMIMARWPNANFIDGSIWDKENHWAHGLIDEDENAYTNGMMIDSPSENISLENIGFNIEGATAILNVGSFKTYTREVLTHNGNTFTYQPVDLWKTKHHDYFLERKLEFLDSEGEWFYDIDSSKVYFWPPNNVNPNSLDIRGKVQSYAFDINNSDYVEIRNIEFFGTTFKFNNSDYSKVDHCNLVYPSCYKRMLGLTGVEPEMSIFNSSSYCTVSNSAFRYTDGSALEMYSNYNTIENCYFYHIDYTATDLNGLMTTIQMGGSNNVFRRNTMHLMGASATLNPGNEAIIELNDMSDSGHMQSDGALVQCMVGQQPNVQIRYNWLHDTEKFGARFDGEGDGYGGHMHHNVIWNVQGGIMVKGYNHNVYNNTAFDNGDKNDIIIMIDQGGNEGTITLNNGANKIAGHRTGSYESYPVPGNYSNNWNGYETNLDIKDLLVDVENNNFMPIENSPLVDSGLLHDSLNIDYFGESPDIGAYEFGGDYWIPGITWDLNQEFGEEFFIPNELYIVLGDVNYDEIVNVIDIVAIINWILSDYYLEIGDINNDNILNVIDAVAIINIIISG
tara:strand:+ start:1381 stop:3438 length:2058 start_codon:yes stop_codon:yes gene_type:complete